MAVCGEPRAQAGAQACAKALDWPPPTGPPRGFSSPGEVFVPVRDATSWPSLRRQGVNPIPSPPEIITRLGHPLRHLEAPWSLLPPASTGGLRPSCRRSPMRCRLPHPSWSGRPRKRPTPQTEPTACGGLRPAECTRPPEATGVAPLCLTGSEPIWTGRPTMPGSRSRSGMPRRRNCIPIIHPRQSRECACRERLGRRAAARPATRTRCRRPARSTGSARARNKIANQAPRPRTAAGQRPILRPGPVTGTGAPTPADVR